MPKEKNIYGRISQKIDTEANWLKAVNFIPNKGEIIIYEKDASHAYDRIKIGDGVSNVNDLPFANELIQADWAQTDETQLDFIKNKPNENDALALLAETGFIDPVAAADGSVFTDDKGTIYTL